LFSVHCDCTELLNSVFSYLTWHRILMIWIVPWN
jgi:hypothetical protein